MLDDQISLERGGISSPKKQRGSVNKGRLSRLEKHKQDSKRICRREYKLLNSSLFTRMHCTQPECTAAGFTRVHCAMKNLRMSLQMSHRRAIIPIRVDFSGYVLLWFSCKQREKDRAWLSQLLHETSGRLIVTYLNFKLSVSFLSEKEKSSLLKLVEWFKQMKIVEYANFT